MLNLQNTLKAVGKMLPKERKISSHVTRTITSDATRLGAEVRLTSSGNPNIPKLDKDMFTPEATRFYRDLPEYSSQVNNKFRKFLVAFASRGRKNVTQDVVERLVQTVLKNKNYKNEKDLLTYLNNLEVLSLKKAPNGELILNGDQVLKLADTRAFKSKIPISQINELIKCAESGLVPSTILKTDFDLITKASGLNPQIISDLQKLKFARENGLKPIDVFIPNFKGPRTVDISKFKTGDMFSMNVGYEGIPNSVYMVTRDNGGIHRLNIDRETLYDLLPAVKRFFLQQNKSGTCYQLASYISQTQNPVYLARLFSRISKNEAGNLVIKSQGKLKGNIFAGKFPDIDKYGHLQTGLKGNRFVAADKQQSVFSNPLMKALEHLYGTKRKYEYAEEYVKQAVKKGVNPKQVYSQAIADMDKYVYVKNANGEFVRKSLDSINAQSSSKTFKCVEDYYKEGGTSHEIFDFIDDYKRSHDYVRVNCNSDSATLSQLRGLLKNPKSVKMFGSKYVPSNMGVREKVIDADKYLYANHAYSVVGYDEARDVVKYVNPWNSLFVFEMKLPELAKKMGTFAADCIV